MIRNMASAKGRLLQGLRVLLAVYLILTFYLTVFSRASSDKDLIRTEWFEGYKCTDERILYEDNLFNILLFVPIGSLVVLVVKRYGLIKAVLIGLFVSETIE